MEKNILVDDFISELRKIATDVDFDEKNNVIYFTLKSDKSHNKWLDTQSCAVCLEYSENNQLNIGEFDIRIGKVSTEDVKEAVDNMTLRFARHVESIDSGHGQENIAHVRNYRSNMPADDFISFMNALLESLYQDFD